jgi:alpha-1,2-mannosyltransferase
MREPKTDPRLPAKAVAQSQAVGWAVEHWRPIALAGSAASVLLWALTVLMHRPDMWTMVDLQTYRSAVGSLKHGQSAIYTRSFGAWPGPFIYPPFAAILLKPLALISLRSAKLAVTLMSFAALGVSVWCAWGQLGLRAGRDRTAATAAVAAASLWIEPVSKTFYYGQVSLLLLALCLADLAKPTRRGSGLLIGLAAGIKLTPLLFAVYLLATRRYRAAANALGCFLATVLAGWLLLPRAAPRYWFHAIMVGRNINRHVSVAYGMNQSIHGLLLRLCGFGHLADALWLLLSGVIALVGLAAAVQAHRLGQEFVAVLLCAGITLFVSPISWTHHWVWILPAAMTLGVTAWRRRSRLLAAATAGYLLTAVVLPLRLTPNGFWSHRAPLLPLSIGWLAPHGDRWDLRWDLTDFLIGNSMLLVNLLLFAVVVAGLLRGRRGWVPGPAAPQQRLEPAALSRQREEVAV